MTVTVKSAIQFNKNNIYLGKSANGYGNTCFANKDLSVGEIVMMGIGKIITHQTSKISVQIGTKKHFRPTMWTGQFWNNSCNPNLYANTRTDGFPNLIALRKIKRGDELTYSYSMTEYVWGKDAEENSLSCKCNDKKCKGKILSFSQLTKPEQEHLIKEDKCSHYLTTLK